MTGIMQSMVTMKPVTITQTPTIYIDANNPSSYSGTGTTITDLTGNGYTQNLVAASQYTVLNGVKCFDCNTNHIVASAVGPTLPTSGFTYIVWARMKSSSVDWRTLLRSSPNDHPIIIQVGADNLGMYDNTINSFDSTGYNAASLANIWVQFAVTGDNSGQTFYINGVRVGTTTQTAAGNGHNYLGAVASAQGFGYVANMKLYTTLLPQQVILQEYINFKYTFALSNVVTTNLVLWYDPSLSASYPGSGSTVYNLASTSLSGTMSNVTSTSPYFSYNGTNSQVTIPDNAALEPGSGDWTMEVWVNQNASGNDVVLGKFDPGGLSADVSYSIRTTGTSYYAQIGSGSGSGSTLFVNSTNFSGTLGTWYQLVYVFKNGATKTLETFVNGASIGTVSHNLASILNTSANLYLGSYNGGEFSQWFDGKIGITRLYNAALTSAEVLQNYNADKNKYGL